MRRFTSIALVLFGVDMGSTTAADPPAPAAAEGSHSVVLESAEPAIYTLHQLTTLAVDRHPMLAQAAYRIDAACGKAIQAGLYPNPVVSVTGDELGDRTGAPGIWTAPQISQEIVTGGKRQLSRAAALKEADQASFTLAAKKFALLGDVRQAYYDALTLQTRGAILEELVDLADKSVQQTKALLQAQQVSRLELVQLEVERERFVVERDMVARELPFAYQKLAAIAGAPDLAILRVDGSIDDGLPAYEHKLAKSVVWNHPEVHAAEAAADRSRILVDRARAQAIPNVTVSTGYTRQSQNRSDDWMLGVSVPLPLFDRNQGAIRTAQAESGEAAAEVARVEFSLQERLATAFREYASSNQRVDRYRNSILPRAQEAYDLSAKAYRGGQFEYLRVVEAQRTVAQARLELVKALGDAWKAAAAISALMAEEQWPRSEPAPVKIPKAGAS